MSETLKFHFTPVDGPQPGHWPEVEKSTPESDMRALTGNGHPMREHFLEQGLARYRDDLPAGFVAQLELDNES